MSSMPRARGARVFRSSRWAPPPLLAALLLDVAIGQAAGISLSKRFHPTRNAFGPNCTFPETSTCHTADKSSTAAAAGVAVGSSLDQLMGMYARHPRTAASRAHDASYAWWRTNVLDAARRPLRLLHSWRAHLCAFPLPSSSLLCSRDTQVCVVEQMCHADPAGAKLQPRGGGAPRPSKLALEGRLLARLVPEQDRFCAQAPM
jgi:hypothetical protein